MTVTNITPNAGAKGTTVIISNLAGTGFQTGAVVNFTRSGSQSITASGVMASTTQITCSLTIPSDATTGSWNVVVTNPDGQYDILTNGFTVMNPAPTVTSINPTTGVNGTVVNITSLTGTGFLPGVTVKLSSGSIDITAANVVIVSQNEITSIFNLAAAALGQWNVVVTNTDSQSGSLSNGFTIT